MNRKISGMQQGRIHNVWHLIQDYQERKEAKKKKKAHKPQWEGSINKTNLELAHMLQLWEKNLKYLL